MQFTIRGNDTRKIPKATSSRLHYHVHHPQKGGVPSYGLLLVEWSMHATSEAAEDVPAPVCSSVHAVQNFDTQW